MKPREGGRQSSLSPLQQCKTQIRQLAERRGIVTLYDFIYRLTCDVVHFNPQVLLRSGWGDLPNVKFSTKNFEAYYRAFAVIYGSFLFCIYFELLRSHLRPDTNTMQTVDKIRETISQNWSLAGNRNV